MKLNEALKNSLAEPLPTAQEIIRAANRRKAPTKRLVVLTAAAAALLGISVSAALALGGFERAFGARVDTGEVEVVSEIADEAEFEIAVTEVWFDENNLHLGGTVTTPEPLEPDGRCEIPAYLTLNGGDELQSVAKIYPTGERESLFVLSAPTGVDGETAEIGLRFERIYDWSRELGDAHIDDYTVYFGEVSLVLDVKSAAKNPLRGSCDGISATLNEFTLELDGDLGEYHAVFVRLSDGSLIGREQGEIKLSSRRDGGLLMTLAKPLDLTKVESVVIVDEWYFHPDASIGEVIDVRLEIPLE